MGGAAGVLGGSLEARPRDGVREGVDVEADEGAHLGVRADDRAGVTARAHRAVDVVSQRAALEALEHLAHQHGHVRGAVRVLLEGVRAAGGARARVAGRGAGRGAARERARYTAPPLETGGDSLEGAGGAARVAGQGESPRAVIALAAEVIAVRLVVRTDASRAPCGARAVGYGVRRPPNADDDARRLWSCSFRSHSRLRRPRHARRATVAVGTARSGGGRRPSRVRVAMDAAGRMGRSTRRAGGCVASSVARYVALAMCALLAFVFARAAGFAWMRARVAAAPPASSVASSPRPSLNVSVHSPTRPTTRARPRDEPRRAPSATGRPSSADPTTTTPRRRPESPPPPPLLPPLPPPRLRPPPRWTPPRARSPRRSAPSPSPPARSSPSPSPTRTFARSR